MRHAGRRAQRGGGGGAEVYTGREIERVALHFISSWFLQISIPFEPTIIDGAFFKRHHDLLLVVNLISLPR
jgi:hypothetical protein